ncbi:putative metal-binding motif-containing protein, partial [Aestuariibaculum suncheonense]|uniref:putative metal-binding motif-containing protein n=1 Tax=Aestuariibaculum suncheonense TaxID=1028745 RepID=UPI0031E9E33C
MLACSAPEGYVSDNTDCDDDNVLVHTPKLYYVDSDGDGYGSTTEAMLCESSAPVGYSDNNTDCDDTNINVHPGAMEQMDNGIDDDCNPGTLDSSATTDDDGDGYSENDGDCDDTNIEIHPGAEDLCDGLDNDCDGEIDEGVKNTYYADNDGDGYGDAESGMLACSAPEGYVSDNTDCDDTNITVYPGAEELCDGLDND